MKGLNREKVELHPYSTEWAEEFKKEKKFLEGVLKGVAIDIQHVGSTSIPGLSAKPILDVAVAVKDKEGLYTVMPLLSDAGYDVREKIDEFGEVLAIRGTPECQTHYIHVEILGSEFWTNHILFRDYLLKHPEYIKMYEDMKKESYAKFKDCRKEYTASKNDFIQNVLRLAKDEQ